MEAFGFPDKSEKGISAMGPCETGFAGGERQAEKRDGQRENGLPRFWSRGKKGGNGRKDERREEPRKARTRLKRGLTSRTRIDCSDRAEAACIRSPVCVGFAPELAFDSVAFMPFY